MISFKQQLKKDIETVFFNTKENAHTTKVQYNEKEYIIPVIFDRNGAKDRKRKAADHAGGVFISGITAYINVSDLGFKPRKQMHIEIGGDEYLITGTQYDAGVITLELEMLDE